MSFVLRSPTRRAVLFGDLRTTVNLCRFLTTIVPIARRELLSIRKRAESILDVELRRQAISSIDSKSYHVAGAAILATFLPRQDAHTYISIVAPLESIYDYLDNLCDRHPDVDYDAYHVLHQAIADACDPHAGTHDYYAQGPSGDDAGYLRDLVRTVQHRLGSIPDSELLLPTFRAAARLYSRMQTAVHAPATQRERLCHSWFEEQQHLYPDLQWNEFVAATGSQFQVYAPLFALLSGRSAEIDMVFEAHFPYVGALHVLLDSYIDRQEDLEHDDLNLVSVMPDPETITKRFAFLANRAEAAFSQLSDPRPHRFVLQIMTLFYLSHPKIVAQNLDAEATALFAALNHQDVLQPRSTA